MGVVTDWGRYSNFSKAEFDCKETGDNQMDEEFMEKLQGLRTAFGKPLAITSGYRSPSHSVERAKPRPGTHSMGIAADIAVSGPDAFYLIALAIKHGFTGIGVAQRAGKARFVHLDIGLGDQGLTRPTVWGY